MLGRWLEPDGFGAFTIAFSVFILLQNIFEGLVFEPLGVFGAGRRARQLDIYVGRLLAVQPVISTALAALPLGLSIGFAVTSHRELARAFLGLAIAVPFMLTRILVRQPLYIANRVLWSMLNSLLFLLCSIAGIAFLERLHSLSPFTTFLCLGSASCLVSALTICFHLTPQWGGDHASLSTRTLIREHWAYGGWAVGERLMLWTQANLITLELPIVAGLQTIGAFRAISTIAMPPFMVTAAMGAALLPIVARAPERSSGLRLLLACAMIGCSGYAVVLVTLGQTIMHIAFAGRYDSEVTRPLLLVVGIGPFLYSVCVVQEVSLRGREMIRMVLHARLLATGALILLGMPLTALHGLMGAALASDLTWVATIVAHLVLRHRLSS